MRVRNILFVLLLFSRLTNASDCTVINDQVKKIIKQNQITGLAIAIVNHDKAEFCNYGYANKNREVPITDKSIFEIASITKTFTALLAGIAAVDNKFDLNAPITRYIPRLSANQNYFKINGNKLLTHTSGIPLRLDKSFTEKELIDSLLSLSFVGIPLRYYQYSNPGIALAGLALTHIYNKSYQDLLATLILDDLAMKYTSIVVNPQYKKLIVTGYDKNDQPVNFMELGIESPAGGLKSNTYDLAKYLQLQINPEHTAFRQALAIVHKNYYCLYLE